jgi:hypothetical protein
VSESETQVVNDIATYGWHMISVPEHQGEPGFTYTIGLFKSYGHPELIIFGLPIRVMQGVIDVAAGLIKSGRRFIDGDQSNGIVRGYPCVFRTVHQDHYREHFGYAMWFYRTVGLEAFPAMQCFWPDQGRHFPWEAECNDAIRALQPFLFVPLAHDGA